MIALARYRKLARRITPETWTTAERWYAEAFDIAQSMVPLLRRRNPDATTAHAAAIISALSPRCRWKTNITRALRFAAGLEVRAMKFHIDKANEIMRYGPSAVK